MILQELNVKIGLLLDEFQKQSEKLKDETKKIGANFTELKGFLVGLGVFEFAKAGVAEFMDHERSVNRLQFALRGLGVDWKAASQEVEEYAQHLQKTTGVNGGEALSSMVSLINVTGNYREAMALMPDILDIVASGQMDLRTATDTVGKAFTGNQRALGMLGSQFGISAQDAKDFGQVMEKVRSATEGAASAQKGIERDLADINNQWKQFQENAGMSTAKLIRFGNEALKTALPIAEGADQIQKAQNKIITAPVNWLAKKGAELLHAVGMMKTQQEKLEEAADKAATPSSAGGEKPKDNRPTSGRVSREEQMNRIALAEAAAKAEYDINKKYGDEYVKLYSQNTAKIAALWGKEHSEYKKHKADELKVTRTVVKDKIDLAETEMNNLVAIGSATDQDRLELMKAASEQIRQLWGAESLEYQNYMQNVLAQTQEAFSFIMEVGQGVTAALSEGFTEFFSTMAKEGRLTEKAFENFARGMGRSFLNAVASAIDAEIVKGTAGYLSNMLAAGPLGAAPVSAYSAPLLVALAATSGMIHGLAGAMEDGGVMTRKGAYLMVERPSGEPEAAIPFSRMGEAFEKYAQFMDKQTGVRKSRGGTVIVQRVFDQRGAGVIASSQYNQTRAAKKVGDTLVRKGIINR